MSRVLIVGAGIGGDTLALLLGRSGWDVTVVEIASGLRTGGQTVDLRGGSRDVLARLGLLEECLAHLVPQRGIAWVDAAGERLAQMPVEAFGGRGFVSSAELLRTDLSRVLHDAAESQANVRHWFDETAETLAEGPDGLSVTFRSHAPATYDLVVGADGTHSRVRSLTFGPEEQFRRPLGLAHAWFTLPERPSTPSLDGWYLVHNAPGSLVVEARPGHAGEQEVGLTFPADTLPPRGDRAARSALLQRLFAGGSWRTPELVTAADAAPGFALDTFDQIHLRSWHRDRIVLLGDSAWCASPLSGLGTALALTGAEALAAALHQRGELGPALDHYEAAMRPSVKAAQDMFPGRVRSYAPRTRAGIRAVAAAVTLAQARPLQGLLTRFAPS